MLCLLQRAAFEIKTSLRRKYSRYSPDLQPDLLPSQLHRLDFEINSYKSNHSLLFGHNQISAFTWLFCWGKNLLNENLLDIRLFCHLIPTATVAGSIWTLDWKSDSDSCYMRQRSLMWWNWAVVEMSGHKMEFWHSSCWWDYFRTGHHGELEHRSQDCSPHFTTSHEMTPFDYFKGPLKHIYLSCCHNTFLCQI